MEGTATIPPCTPLEAGDGFVAAKWGLISVVGVYAPPSWDLAEFERTLYDLEACVRRCLPGRVMVAGDFNAKSLLWGSLRTDQRGRALEEWAAGLGLELINTGRASTCVRRQGTSIIDLTWANSPAAHEISGWRVVADQETLSNHMYIEMVVRATPPELLARRQTTERKRRRWAFKKIEKDYLKAGSLRTDMGRWR
ncbi:uncharacterized protein [Temnothorax nylanderi]|uniref:uncharacterized protein n=1 Tax=Temnothorax nylanderi TaxID=102681 RepID=UPI003A8B5532